MIIFKVIILITLRILTSNWALRWGDCRAGFGVTSVVAGVIVELSRQGQAFTLCQAHGPKFLSMPTNEEKSGFFIKA